MESSWLYIACSWENEPWYAVVHVVQFNNNIHTPSLGTNCILQDPIALTCAGSAAFVGQHHHKGIARAYFEGI